MSVIGKQFLALFKQELRISSRSKYIKLTFIFLPLFIWILQGGEYLMLGSLLSNVDHEGETLYIANIDQGNGTVVYGDQIVNQLRYYTVNIDRQLYGVNLKVLSNNYYLNQTMVEMVRNNKTSPLLVLHENFSNTLQNFNASDPESQAPVIDIITFPEHKSLVYSLLDDLFDVIGEQPFTVFEVQRESLLVSHQLSGKGEEGASNVLFNGIIVIMSVVFATMAPSAYISAAIAQEKQKKTLESLLSLPIKRTHILLAKISAGLFLTSIFSILNMVGMFIFKKLVMMAQDEFIVALGKDLSNSMIVLVSASMFLGSAVSIGVGISIVSLMNDAKAAENAYMFSMMIPSAVIASYVLGNGIPTNLLWFTLPWTNIIAILLKLLYPITYEASMLTSSMQIDILLHFIYLILFSFLSLLVAGKLFSREKMIL